MAIGTTAAILGGAALVGGSAALASRSADKAADKQARAAREATQAQKDAGELIRQDLAPFRDIGVNALDQLSGLVTDPNQQKQFIQENPFFDALAGRATETILQNKAAVGRAGSGSTSEALQKSLVLLGSDLLNQRVAQTQGLVDIGQAASAQQVKQTQATASNVGNLALQAGNVAAQEVATQGNIFQQGLGQLGGLAGFGSPVKL
jgi:hypothetical protein